METSDKDLVGETASDMERAEAGDDQTRLETLEKVHDTLESELNEGAETPPA